MKKLFAIISVLLCIFMSTTAFSYKGYEWADAGIEFCTQNKIMEGDEEGNLNLGNNIKRSEMAKMICVSCVRETIEQKREMKFSDIPEEAWFYPYVLKIQDYITGEGKSFRPDEAATREEFISTVIYAAEVLTNVDENVLDGKFKDAGQISEDNVEAMNAAVFHGYIIGDDSGLRPLDNLTRAEACVFLERILNQEEEQNPSDKKEETEDEEEDKPKEPVYIDGVPVPTDKKYTYAKTSIFGESEKTLEEALKWAKKNNAAQCFIDVAPLYWYYGEIFGIRADCLYAQAAKETGFGKYTGKVKPEMNNWAGIKKYGAVGDETEDHETFETPDDGVRGHFNHMSAYVGVDPVGETHGRYKSVKSLTWAGTIEYIEQLGGKWCPDVNYGYSILADYIDKM